MEDRAVDAHATFETRRGAATAAAVALVVLSALGGTSAVAQERWTDDRLVASYGELEAGGGLDAAIRSPVLPNEAQPAFLQALAWFAAGNPERAGALSLEELDEYLDRQVEAYRELLAAGSQGQPNDYARTRTWKLIQKLSLLREEIEKPANEGRYGYPAFPRVSVMDDPWEAAHTLGSEEEFARKVCGPSFERPVIVKYGNTNCTQCMLFEVIGSVKAFATHPEHEGVDVYKVWWGLPPDASFAGQIREPARLDRLVAAEDVRSSPTFVVYRNGRRYSCGSGFPDAQGRDRDLEACLAQDFGEAPMASVCSGATAATSQP